jgi:hypothetical protein
LSIIIYGADTAFHGAALFSSLSLSLSLSGSLSSDLSLVPVGWKKKEGRRNGKKKRSGAVIHSVPITPFSFLNKKKIKICPRTNLYIFLFKKPKEGDGGRLFVLHLSFSEKKRELGKEERGYGRGTARGFVAILQGPLAWLKRGGSICSLNTH